MKNLIILLLMYGLTSFSQTGNSISLGIDPSNALFGSDVNVPALDIQAKLTFREEYSEYGLFIESFTEIKYFNWGVYWHANIWNIFSQHEIPDWQILGGFELSEIIKKEAHRSAGYYTYAANLISRYNFGNYRKFGLESQLNFERRPEWDKYVISVYINFIYHFKL